MKKISLIIIVVLLLGLTFGCARDSDVASWNISKEADQFRVVRRIVFYNSITDTYILEMIGRCSIEITDVGKTLEVTCKIGEEAYQKHFLGLSDNVTYTVEQLETSDVSVYQYELVFKPLSIMPINIDIE